MNGSRGSHTRSEMEMKNGFRIPMFALLIPLIFSAVMGQWSPDSLQNLAICDLTGEQVLPKMVATSDGGCFITWFDSRSGSYSLYIQRLDSLGNELLAEDGMLVSDNPQQSWLVDYDLGVDSGDNAVVAFSDIRYTGDLDVTAYRIGSDGSFLWGADGICLSDTSSEWFEPAPRVAVTAMDNSVVCWGRSSGDDHELVFQKISSAGDKIWGDNGIIWTSGDSDLSGPAAVPAGQDSVVAMWKSSTGNFPAQVTHLYTQKLDVSGDMAWGDTYILIYDGGAITPWNEPELISDGQGGAVYSWYDAPSLSDFNVWVQRMDASGTMLFPMNGAQASTNSSDRLHMNPSAAYYPSGDMTFAFWVETNDNQDMFGVCGQRFSSTGEREWGDSGIQLVPMGSGQVSFVRTMDQGGGLYVGYLIGSAGSALRAIRLGYDGAVEWGPVTLSAASLGGKDDLVDCSGQGGSAVYSWTDYRNDYGVYAQNVNSDGSLGPSTGLEEETGRLTVTLEPARPNPFAGHTEISFIISDDGPVRLSVYDMTGRLVMELADEAMQKGRHTVRLHAGELAPGVYLYRLGCGGMEAAGSCLLLD